jgi:hypothetical protein
MNVQTPSPKTMLDHQIAGLISYGDPTDLSETLSADPSAQSGTTKKTTKAPAKKATPKKKK